MHSHYSPPPFGGFDVVDRAVRLSPFVYGYDRDSIDDGDSGDDSTDRSARTDEGSGDDSSQPDGDRREAIEAAE